MRSNGSRRRGTASRWCSTTRTYASCSPCEGTSSNKGYARSAPSLSYPLRSLSPHHNKQVHVPAEERQWSHDRKMLLTHPPNQTDSFILFTKTTILLSHVKNFTLRFRGRYFAGDAAMYSPASSPEGGGGGGAGGRFDPRDTPAFQELDHVVASFRPSFPSHMRNPTQDDMVDPYLFAASSGAHLYVPALSFPFFDSQRVLSIPLLSVISEGAGTDGFAFRLSSTPLPEFSDF